MDRRLIALVCVAASAAPDAAHANAVEEELGVSARIKSMGGAGTALATDFSAVYYNPSNLARCPTTSLTLSYDYAQYELRTNDEEPHVRKEPLRPFNAYMVGVCGRLPFGLAAGVFFSQGVQRPAFLLQTSTDDDAMSQAYASADLFALLAVMPDRGVNKGGTQPVLNDYSFGGSFFNLGMALTLGC